MVSVTTFAACAMFAALLLDVDAPLGSPVTLRMPVVKSPVMALLICVPLDIGGPLSRVLPDGGSFLIDV